MFKKELTTIARAAVIMASCAALALVAGCSANGSGSGTNNASGNAPNLDSFQTDKNPVKPGEQFTLTWDVKDAASCNATGNFPANADTQKTKANVVITAPNQPGSSDYVLTCTSPDGSVSSKDILIVVGDFDNGNAMTPPGVAFAANPAIVGTGGTTTLTWSSSMAATCLASGGDTTDNDGWAGQDGTSGTFTTQPLTTPGTYNYTLTCTATNGSSSQNTLTVLVRTPNNGNGGQDIPLTATPPGVDYDPNGGPTTVNLLWNRPGADSCTVKDGAGNTVAGGGAGSNSGNAQVSVDSSVQGTTTYTLHCIDKDGNTVGPDQSVDVTVAPGAGTVGTGNMVPLTASPATIDQGMGSATVNLTWNQPGASSCTLTGPDGNPVAGAPSTNSYSGNVPVTVDTTNIDTFTYTLNCIDANGDPVGASQSVDVSVVSPGPVNGGQSIPLTAQPSTIEYGSGGGTTSVQLVWNQPDAATCTLTGPDGNPVAGVPSDSHSGNVKVDNVDTNTAGTSTYTLQCTGMDGTPFAPQTADVTILPNPADANGTAPIDLTASPTELNYGGDGKFVLIWNQPTAASCGLTGPDGTPITLGAAESGSDKTNSGFVSQTVNTTAAQSFTYTLQCSDAAGTPLSPQTATVSVRGAAIGGGNNPVPTKIKNGNAAVPGNFACLFSASALDTPGKVTTTAVGTNGLVGGPLSRLLGGLGGDTVVALLNSVRDADRVIDGNLDSFATFSVTAGGLGSNTLNNVQLNVLLPEAVTVPVGQYAVFKLGFPSQVVGVSLGDTIQVTTYLDNNVQEAISTDASTLDLLGGTLLGNDGQLYFGLQVTKPYDRATLSYKPALLNVNAGDRLNAFELCIGGSVQPAP